MRTSGALAFHTGMNIVNNSADAQRIIMLTRVFGYYTASGEHFLQIVVDSALITGS
jgi:hypothetical protein